MPRNTAVPSRIAFNLAEEYAELQALLGPGETLLASGSWPSQALPRHALQAAGMRQVAIESSGDYSGIASNLIPYAEAVRSVAGEKQVPLVDLHGRSIEILDRMGKKATEELNPPSKDPGKTDHTHLSARGSEIMAGLVADELRKVEPELAKHFK